MYEEIKKHLRIVVGIALIIIGTAGIFLPVLPGWILIFVGIEFIGIQLVFLDNIKAYVKQRLEEVSKKKKR